MSVTESRLISIDFHPPGGHAWNAFGYGSLDFHINTAASSVASLRVLAYMRGGWNLTSPTSINGDLLGAGGDPTQNEWHHVSIPLCELDPVNQLLDLIRISAYVKGTYYIDDMRLVSMIPETLPILGLILLPALLRRR